MRGVDDRGGAYADGGNPPSGGRGRGMVLPAWMTSQQFTPQAGGPVSFSQPHEVWRAREIHGTLIFQHT